MNRFFLPPASFESDRVTFPPEVAHQMARVLRLQPGARVITLDGSGSETLVELVDLTPQTAWGRALERRPVLGEPGPRLWLYLGLTQREKFEWMLQKCTETGAAGFTPLISARSLVQRESEVLPKLERWQRIVQEAAEQSGRGLVPPVHPPLRLNAALTESARHDLCLLAWEEEHTVGLNAALSAVLGQPAPHLAALIGPEGGFSAIEAAQAVAAGVQPLTLGPRILRMETAAVVLTALVLHHFEG